MEDTGIVLPLRRCILAATTSSMVYLIPFVHHILREQQELSLSLVNKGSTH